MAGPSREPIIRLQLLGRVDLRSPAGEIAAVVAQPKRLALLAVLAAAPSGTHRRDTLLAMFWPDLDQDHARKALNKAIHFLRESLGAGAVVSHGAGELTLDHDLVWCDVPAFRAALEAEDLAGALELYRGDLLPGFFIAAGPQFEEWLERERARLREHAVDAAVSLSEKEEASGRLPSAVTYARRALDLSNGDERPLRRLIDLLDKMGDRVAAVRIYEEFARTLARDLELEPTAETAALMDRVRGQPAMVPARQSIPSPFRPAIPVGAAENEGIGPSAEVRAAISPPRRVSAWRVAATAAAGAVLVTAIAAPLWLPRPAPAARAAGARTDVVAVLPFTVRGSDELAYLQEGMVDLLSVNLGGEGGLRTVNPRTLLSLAARQGGVMSLQDPERIRTFAQTLGAGSYIAGTVLGMGDRVQLTAMLSPLNAAQGDTLQARVEGPVRDLAALVDRLTRQLLLGQLRGEGARFAGLAASTTSSLEALKAFLEGERYWRTRESDSAVASFHRAVTYDSSFALAYYRLAVAASWLPGGESGDALDHALRHLDRLPTRQRNLVLAFNARRRGEPARAESLYHAVLHSSPDDGEAWFQLGSLLVHHQVLWGRPIRQVRQAFERALALDPNHPRAPGALSWLDGHEGHHAKAAARMQQLLAQDRGEAKLLLHTALAFWRGDAKTEAEVMDTLRQIRNDSKIVFVTDFVGQRAGDLEGAVRVATLLTEPSRSLAVRIRGYRAIANLELAGGRPRAASAALAELEKQAPAVGIQVGALTLLNPHFALPLSVSTDLRNKLTRWEPATLGDSVRREYLLGLLASRAGDIAVAAAMAERLQKRAAQGPAVDSSRQRTMVRDLALSIRADLAWRAGRLSQALSLLQQRHPNVWVPPEMDVVENEQMQVEYCFLNQAYERWMQAELLTHLGRPAEALDWYAGLGIYPSEEMAYLTPSRMRMGEIQEQLGDTAQAIEQYSRVVRLWTHSDPELQPFVGKLRRTLALLQRR